MAFKKVGDWEKIGLLIGNLAKEMEDSRQLALKRWGLKAEGLAKGHMSKQDLPWKPLDPKTISAKVRQGYSENILIRTSSYFQSITSFVEDNTAYAGVKKTAKNREGQQIADIAATHEYGSKSGNIPARPLWKPVYAETMEWFKTSDSRPDRIFEKKIKKYL